MKITTRALVASICLFILAAVLFGQQAQTPTTAPSGKPTAAPAAPPRLDPELRLKVSEARFKVLTLSQQLQTYWRDIGGEKATGELQQAMNEARTACGEFTFDPDKLVCKEAPKPAEKK